MLVSILIRHEFIDWQKVLYYLISQKIRLSWSFEVVLFKDFLNDLLRRVLYLDTVAGRHPQISIFKSTKFINSFPSAVVLHSDEKRTLCFWRRKKKYSRSFSHGNFAIFSILILILEIFSFNFWTLCV